MRSAPKTTKGFTLVELMIAVTILAITIAGMGVVFGISIEAYRRASATAEVMRNIRAITQQINADFAGLRKDGCLLLRSANGPEAAVRQGDETDNIHRDSLIYFATGDYQSLTESGVRSNIAGIYLGPYKPAVDPNSTAPPPASEWVLLRHATLLCPGEDSWTSEYINFSFAELKARPDFPDIFAPYLSEGFGLGEPLEAWQYFCSGVGQVKIEWASGRRYPDGELVWFGVNRLLGDRLAPRGYPGDGVYARLINETYRVLGSPPNTFKVYTAQWGPEDYRPEDPPAPMHGERDSYWPEALKFTFTLYDSNGVLKDGMQFSHIVYLDD